MHSGELAGGGSTAVAVDIKLQNSMGLGNGRILQGVGFGINRATLTILTN